MEVIAVLGQIFGVSSVERETVAAGLQLSRTVVALPVLVTRYVMGVEAEVVRAFEGLLADRCNETGRLKHEEVIFVSESKTKDESNRRM